MDRNSETICLSSAAFFQLLDEVVKRIEERYDAALNPWISTVDAMDLLQIKSKTTLLNLRSTGQIRYSQPQHKIILYDRVSILDYIEKHAKNTF